MKRLLASLLLLLAVVPAALADDQGERVYLFDLTYHTADGSITPDEIQIAKWPYKLPAATEEDLRLAEHATEETRRQDGFGVVVVDAITADGKVHYRAVQPIYAYRMDGSDVIDPSFRVRVPVEGTARIHIKGWREKTEATFEVAELLRSYAKARAVTLADPPPPELPAKPNRMNVLVMAEGYVKYNAAGRDEEPLFNADFSAITSGAFGITGVTPFHHYASYFNFQKKFFGAAQGFPGIHHPACGTILDPNARAQQQAQANGAVVVPVWGTKFCENGTNNTLGGPADRAAVVRKAEELMPGVNTIVLLVNDFTHDGRLIPSFGGHGSREVGSSPGFIVFVVQRDRPGTAPVGQPATLITDEHHTADIFIHEVGHALFHLADEYSDGPTPTETCDDATTAKPCEWNITNLAPTAQRPVKWSLWTTNALATTVFCDRNSQTQVPTAVERCEVKPDYQRTISAFEGARRQSSGWYRPMYTCRMKAHHVDRGLSGVQQHTEFCPICKEGIMRRIYRAPAAPGSTRTAGIQLHDEQPGTQHTVPPLVPATSPAPIRLIRSQFQEFKATPVSVPHALQYSWNFNGTALTSTGPSHLFLADRSGVLELKIVDPMPKEPIPYTSSPLRPLVLEENRTANMQDVVRWPIEVRNLGQAESGPVDQEIRDTIDFPVAKGTEYARIDWGVITEEFANRCTGCGDEWRVMVTPAPSSGTSAASTPVVLFERGKVAGPDHLGFNDTATFRVADQTANGDATLRLTVSVTSKGDDKAKTIVKAEVGGVPGAGCTTCPVCEQDPKPPECGLSLAIESLEFLPLSATDGDSSYVSFEPQGSVSTFQRFLKMKTTPVHANATLKTTVYIVNDRGEDVGTAVQGIFPTERWPLEQQGSSRTDWRIRVTQHDGKDIQYTGKPLTHEFKYRVHLLLTLGQRTVEASAVIGSIVTGDAPGLPAAPRPLHSLVRAGTRWRYAPTGDDREGGGDNWASLATARWFGQFATQDNRESDISKRVIGRMDDVSLEHAIRNSQHPGSHQWGTDVSIYHWYQFGTRGSDIDAGRQYSRLRRYAQEAQQFIDRGKRDEALRELTNWTKATREGIDRLLSQGNIKIIHHALGQLCGGNSDPDWPFNDNLHPAFIRQLLWEGKVTLHGDSNGQILFDLNLGGWGATSAYGGYVDYTCHATFETEVQLDRCKLGETPGPCGTGRRRAVRHPSCVECMGPTTTATLGQNLTLAVSATNDPEETTGYRWYKGAVYDFSQPVDGGVGKSINFTVTGPEKYWVYIYNSAGFITSGTQIVICNPPKITGQTIESYINLGQTTTIHVETSGSEPKKYEWYTGVSSPTTKLDDATPTRIPVTPSIDTKYWARITNACGTVLSDPITVFVCEPVKIKTQPQPMSVIEDNLASLSLLATGTEPITYEWFEGEVDGGGPKVPLCTGNTCSFYPKATGKYWAKVSNRCSVDKSVAVTITVIPKCIAPSVSIHPEPKTIDKGEEATLSVVATGTNPAFQWYVGGKGNTQIEVPNGTTSEIKVRPDTTTSYWVRVRNSCGTFDSNAAQVTVIACDPAKIDVQPAGATIEPGETAKLSVTASGTPTLTYQWYQRQLLSGEEFEVENGNGPNLSVTPSRTTWYFVEVDNHCGAPVRSNTVAVLVSETCRVPQITTQPTPVTLVNAGDEARLEVRASGSQPFTYEWFIGASPDTGTLIPNETDAVLVVHPLQTTTYSVRVSNDCGHAVSAAVTVTVPVPCDLRITRNPTSTTLLQGQTVTLLARGEGSGTVTHQWYRAVPGGEWQEITGATDTRYDATPDDTTYYMLRASNDCAYIDSEVAVVTVITGCTRPEFVIQPESVTTGSSNQVELTGTAVGTAPLQYQWYEYINGWPTRILGQTTNRLLVTPTLNVRTFHLRVTNSCFSTVSVNVTVQLVPACEAPSITEDPQSKTITRGQSVTLNASASGSSPSYQWYRGDSGGNWTLISGATGTSLTESPQVTTYYYVKASNSCGEDDSNYAIVTVNESGGGGCTAPPLINKHIESMTVSSGAPATMTIIAQNVGRYEWYRSSNLSGGSWEKVEGATNYFLTVHPTETTYYFVRVINDCGQRDSMVATISVTTACVEPRVIWISDIIKFWPGDQILVSIQASGTNLRYEWFKSDPAGSGSKRLSGSGPEITDYPQSEHVLYWANVSNDCGTVFSGYANARSLAACTVPRITQQPQDKTISPGESATLSVTVEAQTAVTYQWYAAQLNFFAWYPLDGETSRTLTVSPNTSTAYYCEITVECATVKSNGAAVFVQP